MAIQFETEQEQADPATMTSLVSGIVNDAKHLVTQQLELFKVEIKHDVKRTLLAFLPIFAAIPFLMTGIFIMGFAGVYLLEWLVPDLPLWGAFAIVGGSIIISGILLIILGKTMLTSFNPLPDQSLEGLKENLQWKTKT